MTNVTGVVASSFNSSRQQLLCSWSKIFFEAENVPYRHEYYIGISIIINHNPHE